MLSAKKVNTRKAASSGQDGKRNDLGMNAGGSILPIAKNLKIWAGLPNTQAEWLLFLAAVEAGGRATRKELSTATGIKGTTLKRALRKLCREGFFHTEGAKVGPIKGCQGAKNGPTDKTKNGPEKAKEEGNGPKNGAKCGPTRGLYELHNYSLVVNIFKFMVLRAEHCEKNPIKPVSHKRKKRVSERTIKHKKETVSTNPPSECSEGSPKTETPATGASPAAKAGEARLPEPALPSLMITDSLDEKTYRKLHKRRTVKPHEFVTWQRDEQAAFQSMWPGYYREHGTDPIGRTFAFAKAYERTWEKYIRGIPCKGKGSVLGTAYIDGPHWRDLVLARQQADRHDAKYDEWCNAIFRHYDENPLPKKALPTPRYFKTPHAAEIYGGWHHDQYGGKPRDLSYPVFPAEEHDLRCPVQVNHYHRLFKELFPLGQARHVSVPELAVGYIDRGVMPEAYFEKFQPKWAPQIKEERKKPKPISPLGL